MKEYIEREALMAHARQQPGGFISNISIQFFPAADVVERKRGEWLLERDPDGKPYCFHCSVCDGDFHYIGISVAYKFCPNCGADMRGEKHEAD